MSDEEPACKKIKEIINIDDVDTIEDSESDCEPVGTYSEILATIPIAPKHIGRGKPLLAQAREVVFNVFQYMCKEYVIFKPSEYEKYFKPIGGRVVQATGVSQDTLTKILNQVDQEGKITNPTKKVAKNPEYDTQFYSSIRDVITEIYFQNETATLWKVISNLETCILKNDMRRILLDMGYIFVKNNNDYAIVESVRTRLKRNEFLEGIKKCRAEGRTLVYMTELSVFEVSAEKKKKLLLNVIKPSALPNKKISYVIVLIWKPNDLKPCDFIITKLVPKEFDTWLRTNLMLQLPDDAALIVSSSLHPNKFSKGYPVFTATTKKMQEWLTENRIPYPKNCLKAQLYNIILKNKNNLPLDNGANFWTDNGYILLQIPKYHWGLNPLEIIWQKLTKYVLIHKVLSTDETLIEDLTDITPEQWKSAMERTMKIEETSRENDLAMDEIGDILGPYDAEALSEEEFSTDGE